MRCPACGVDVVAEAVYCHKCGGRFDSPVEGFQQAVAARRETQNQPEEELWRGGYSSKAMFGVWVAGGLASLALLAAGIVWAKTAAWWLILLTLITLPWLYYLAVLCYRRMNVHYLLTTQRFVHESGILRRVTDRIEVIDMDDITFEQGLLERLTGVGAIRITSSDLSHPKLLLPGIENVKEVATLFDDARLAERRRRGLHIEQI